MSKGTKMALIIGGFVLMVFFLVPSLVIGFIALNPGGLATPWRSALGL